jgi:hypothetical protein
LHRDFFITDEDVKRAVKEEGGIETIRQIVNNYPRDEEIQTQGLLALEKLN